VRQNNLGVRLKHSASGFEKQLPKARALAQTLAIASIDPCRANPLPASEESPSTASSLASRSQERSLRERVRPVFSCFEAKID
jgi:hypothetical protein